jgi:hypothetical protein
MNQIALLFKEFNSNTIFLNIIHEIESDESDENIILTNVCSSKELMDKFRTFVDDDNIIKEKIIIRISQAKKTYLKNKDKILETKQVITEQIITNNNDQNNQIINENIENNNLVFDYKTNEFLKKYDIDDDNKNPKVNWISPFIRLEQIDHLVKMTTITYELYY